MLERILPRNEHMIDRVVRGLIGIAGFAGVAMYPDLLAAQIAAVVGGILFVTALVGSCPIYTMLGLSTRPKDA